MSVSPRDPIIEVNARFFGEKRIQPHSLDIGEFDTMGQFFLCSGSEFVSLLHSTAMTTKHTASSFVG